MMQRVVTNVLAVMFIMAIVTSATGQSLEDRLDEDRFLRGLTDLMLPEVLEQYVAMHPPTDDVRAAEYQFAIDRMNINQPHIQPHQREMIVRRMLQRRAELIEDYPDDARRAIWLADQAADVFFVLLRIDASGVVTQLGTASTEQRDRAKRATEMMFNFAREAEAAVDRTILDLESTPGFPENITLQLQRRRLVEDQRERRIPFLLGIAACLHGSINLPEGVERTWLMELALRTLQPLADTLHPPLNRHARLYAAFAAGDLGQAETAAALFASVMNEGESGDALLNISAKLGSAQLRAARNPDAALRDLATLREQYTAAGDIFYRLLIADVTYRIMRHHDADAAFAAYTDLLDAHLELPANTVRDLVLQRLMRIIDPATPTRDLPPMAAIARARLLAEDESSSHEAIESLEQLLLVDLNDRERALALFTLGRIHHSRDELMDAARLFLRLARDHPVAIEAEQAVETGVALAAEVYRRDGEAAADLLREGLDIILRVYPNLATIESWRFMAGRLALHEQRYDEALAHFTAVALDSPQGLEAVTMRAQTLRMLAREHDDAALHGRIMESIAQARPILLRAMQRADDVEAAQRVREHLAQLQVIEAETHLRAGEAAAALASIDGLGEDDELPGSIVAEALQVRIDAYRALGQSQAAQQEIDRFIAAAPERAAQVLLPWLTSLQRETLELIEQHRDEQAQQLAREEMIPLARRLQVWMRRQPNDAQTTQALHLRIADAYRLGGLYEEALSLYDRLLEESPTALNLLFGRAECLYHLGLDDAGSAERRLGDAILIYRRISSAGPSVGRMYFWQSHLRTLQILDRIGRNTQQILPQIQRLRLRDQNLGGDPYRRGFELLQNKYALSE